MPSRQMRRWTRQTAFTDPGTSAAYLAAISSAPEHAVTAIQGLLIHGEAVERYGIAPKRFSRETLPVEMRLAAILAADNRPLNIERALPDRVLGTCRDYAVLMCAAMRQHGRPARVRCGFASYFEGWAWQDHWICEVWSGDRWQRIDAQLDDVTRGALQLTFVPWDLPQEVFLTADEAWRNCRTARLDPMDLGHDEARGLWFVYVNLVRDRLALADCITSDWDGWRAVASNQASLGSDTLTRADGLASEEVLEPPSIKPWWFRA